MNSSGFASGIDVHASYLFIKPERIYNPLITNANFSKIMASFVKAFLFIFYSRKHFTEHAAEKWWAENGAKLCERHHIQNAV